MNPLGHPVAMYLSGANAADRPHLPVLIAGVDIDAVLADKGYDSDANRDAIRATGPNRASRRGGTGRSESSTSGTCTGSGTERFFGRVKRYRRVATRYDKKARNFLGFVWLAAIDSMLA